MKSESMPPTPDQWEVVYRPVADPSGPGYLRILHLHAHGSTWVAVGNYGLVLRSVGGRRWSQVKPFTTDTVKWVGFDQGRFVARSCRWQKESQESHESIWSSVDGEHWEHDRFVRRSHRFDVDSWESHESIWSSVDGEHWEHDQFIRRRFVWEEESGVGYDCIWSSADGEHWEQVSGESEFQGMPSIHLRGDWGRCQVSWDLRTWKRVSVDDDEQGEPLYVVALFDDDSLRAWPAR